MIPREQVGALVVGGEHPGLGVVRSLGKRGIPVYVLDDQLSVSRFSRYATRVVRVKDLRDERKTVDAILETGRRFNLKNWVLFPTRDETVAAISRYRAELADFFIVPTPEWDTVRWAWDKKNTYELAEKLKIPCPQTFNPKSADDLPALYSKLPLAIKPAVKENFFYATGAKAWRASTPEELRRAYAKAASQIRREEILVQQIIPGDGQRQVSYCAFYRDGKAHGVLLARRERQHPREFGRAATYVETIDLPAIEELSERFLRAINYYGLVEVEFKQDPRDGEYKLLDVNARTWGFHILGSCVGVDFPYLQFADSVGQPVTDCRGRAGVGWLRWVTDLPEAVSEIFDGELSIGSYIGSLRRTGVESVFNLQDPVPAIAEVALLPYLVATKYFHSEPSRKEEPVRSEPDADQTASAPVLRYAAGESGQTCHEINPLLDSRWTTLVENHPSSSVFHTRAWLEALRRTYEYEPVAYTTDSPDRELQNALVFCRIDSWLTGQRLVSLPFSDHCEPLWNDSNLAPVLGFLNQKLRDRELDYVELRPMRAVDENALLSNSSSRSYCFHQLDLRSGLDALFSNFHKDSTQRKIRRAEREHLDYAVGNSESLLDSFCALYLLTRRRHGVPPQPREWFQNLIQCFGDALQIRIASKDNRPVAAIITLRHKNTLVYKYGCSDPQFNNLGGTQLLFWRSIEEAKYEGLEMFDLGRSETDNQGLITFKDRWGAARSNLTYSRFATSPRSSSHYRVGDSARREFLTKRFVGYLPDRLLTSVGDLLYKHVG